jgi:tetratricopeptide (TPR) repeat protein
VRAVSRDRELPPGVSDELERAVGRQSGRELARKMKQAVDAYERDRYEEASRLTRPLVQLVPESVAVRELHGLVCYRLGRWKEAARHLETAMRLGGGPDQLPVIMDCRRAMGHRRKVETLFEDLRRSSPPADVMSEGRLVLAGQLADQGELDAAIELLVTTGAARNVRNPAARHLRQWYALADLYERAGEIPRARELFARVAEGDPELADARNRLIDLGRGRAAGSSRSTSARDRSRSSSASGGEHRPRPGRARPGKVPSVAERRIAQRA